MPLRTLVFSLLIWLSATFALAPASAVITGPRHHDATEVQCDIPADLHVRNRAGTDGSGLCVFASMKMSGHWHDEPVFLGLFEWMRARPGGGYPSKVDAMVSAFCKEKGLSRPMYLQIESANLDILRLACRTGRLPAVTYAISPTGRYGGRRLSHMVSLLAAGEGKGPDGKGWWVILDNNHPGGEQLEWMSESQFRRTYTNGASGWAIVLLRAGPPPVPRNQRRDETTREELPNDRTPDAETNFGVERAQLQGGERYTLNGQPITREQLWQALGASRSTNVPDDTGLRRLTVIGEKTLRERVLHDLDSHTALARWRGKLLAHGYEPTHWHVSRVGFVTTGKPTIYVQSSNGIVLHRQDDYDDGAEGLATALRRTDPDYRPEADVDQRRPPAPAPVPTPPPAPVPAPAPVLPTIPAADVPWSVWVVTGVAFLILFVRGKKS
jgi:hypothetical protein